MVRVTIALMVLGACRFAPQGSERGDGGAGDGGANDGAIADAPVDAPIDAAVDAPVDARTCPPAPAGCTPFTCAQSSSCYYLCAPQGWQAANTRCATAGVGCLATIGSADENACLQGASQPGFPNLVWFGWRQVTGGAEPGGGWGWQCGSSPFVAGNWGMFEPNDEGGNEDCGAMGTGGAWIDGTCSTALRFVCELP